MSYVMLHIRRNALRFLTPYRLAAAIHHNAAAFPKITAHVAYGRRCGVFLPSHNDGAKIRLGHNAPYNVKHEPPHEYPFL